MKTYICFAAAVILTFSCGGEQAPVGLEEPAGPEIDTLTVTDSIGVLMGDSCYMFGSIIKAEALPDGGVLLLDRSTSLISVFDLDGKFVRSFGGMGEAPGKFNLPGQMTVLGDGRIAVVDWMDREICFFSPEGEYLGATPCTGYGRPLSMTAAGDSCFAIYSCPTRQIEGTFRLGYEINFWKGMSEEPIATPFSHLFDFGMEEYDFRPGYLAIAAGSNSRIYLHRMNSEEYLIEVLDLYAQPIDSIYSEALLLSWDEVERYPSIPFTTFRVMIDDESQQLSGELTEYVPQVENLGVDSLGNLWAQRGTAPGQVWDVFSPEGEKIREVYLTAFPDSMYIHVEINEHGIVAWDLVPEDYPRLYRLGFR
ncbi:MAG: 6-bladed beta-propeller [Candidatus Aegiribacteria sp.]|nr:6-bladed beta-propeller [Candidatus Aegiribacteria sp.]